MQVGQGVSRRLGNVRSLLQDLWLMKKTGKRRRW